MAQHYRSLAIGAAAVSIGILLIYLGVWFGFNCYSFGGQLDRFFGSERLECLYSSLSLVAGAILVIIGIILLATKLRSRTRPITNSEATIFGVIVVSVIFFVVLTVTMEYIPSNDLKIKTGDKEKIIAYINRPSTLLIPIRSIFEPVKSNLQLIVYQNPQAVKAVTGAKLSTESDSVLSYYGDFKRKGKDSWGFEIWDMDILAKHTGEVRNTTSPYTVDIFYINKSNSAPEVLTTTFDWPIKTMDFNKVSYFFMVLIGVLVSKYTSKIIESKKNEKPRFITPSKIKQEIANYQR